MYFVIFDTETTGLSPQKDRIIEIAAYIPHEKREFVALINPQTSIPPEASRVHHITDAMVANAPTWPEIFAQFQEFCGENAVLVGHNADAFDFPFLKEECKRFGISFPENWKCIDSLKWARKFRPDLPRHSLQSLREVYDIAALNAHRALDDVIVLWELFSRMIEDLTPQQVLQIPSKKRVVTHMPFGKHQGIALKDLPQAYVTWLKSSGVLEKGENSPLKEALNALALL